MSMTCLVCKGSGCKECNNTGEIDITQCPLEFIEREVWDVIRYAELFEKGLPPVAGGVLDQAYCFIEACEFIFGEQRYWKNKLGILF